MYEAYPRSGMNEAEYLGLYKRIEKRVDDKAVALAIFHEMASDIRAYSILYEIVMMGQCLGDRRQGTYANRLAMDYLPENRHGLVSKLSNEEEEGTN